MMGLPPEQGLAQQPQQVASPDREMIEQVKEALLAGMTPEELIAQGAPEAAVQVAVQELQAEMGPQGQPAQPAQGLAAGPGL